MPSSSPRTPPHPRPPESGETRAPAGPGDLHVTTVPTGLCAKTGAEQRLAPRPAPLKSAGRFDPHQFVKFPTDVGQTRHLPHLINQEEISAARSSGKCSFQDDFWETEEGSELLQPTGAGFGHGSGVWPLPALR